METVDEFFVICIDNQGYLASLETKKVYRAQRDPEAEALGMTRVFDESGEDYLYPAAAFVAIQIPAEVEAVFSGAG